MLRKPLHHLLAFPIALLILLSGCAPEKPLPTAPQSPLAGIEALRSLAPAVFATGRDIFPLNLGSRWVYEGSFVRTEGPRDGDRRVTKQSHWEQTIELVGYEFLGGKEYVREKILYDQYPNASFVSWLREDRDGLYEAAVPPLGYSGPVPYEEVRLRYPLHTGEKWGVGAAGRITAEVMGMELIGTPAGRFRGWKIRLRDGGHLPSEEKFVWCGPQGFLGSTTHVEFMRRYPNGDTVLIVEDESVWLKSLDLSPRVPAAEKTR